jgi:EF-hand domain pair
MSNIHCYEYSILIRARVIFFYQKLTINRRSFHIPFTDSDWQLCISTDPLFVAAGKFSGSCINTAETRIQSYQLAPLLRKSLSIFYSSRNVVGRSFKRIDEDKNGMIDFREFKDALKYEAIVVSHEIARQCFDQMDTDHSGTLSFDEFLVALRVSSCCSNDWTNVG